MSNTTNLQVEWEYWYPRVYGYFYKRIDSKIEVEDLTAGTLTTVFLAKDVINLRSYMWKVAHNYLVRYIDTKSKSPIVVGWDENQSWTPDPRSLSIEDDTISNVYIDKMSNLRTCIDSQLSDQADRDLIQLSIYQEKNSTEIGALLNLKSGTIRQKLARLLLKLKTHCTSLWSESLAQ